MKGAPNAAMEVQLSLPPLDLCFMRKARAVVYRMQCVGNQRYHQARKLPGLMTFCEQIFLERFQAGCQRQLTFRYNIVLIELTKTRSQDELSHMRNALTLYTDGSTTSKSIGSGVYDVRPRKSVNLNLGKWVNCILS